MRNPNDILIAVPSKGSLRWETFFSFLRTCTSEAPKKYQITIIPFGGCDVCHARNLAFHYWRTRSTAGRLHFIDSDTVFGMPQLLQIWEHGLPFIGGLYPLNDWCLRWSYNGWSRQWGQNPKIWEVFEICTGFLTMSYEECFVKLLREEDKFDIEDSEYRGEVGYEVCKMGLVATDYGTARRRRIPEDFYLSRIVRERAKLPILADPVVQIGHVQTVELLKHFSIQLEKAKKPTNAELVA